jgi:hypothetical protein
MRPAERFDFVVDGSRPRSKATSKSALIHTRSDSGRDDSFADISPNAPRFAEVAEQFLTEHVEAKRAASSAASYRDLLERLAIPDLGKRKAEKVIFTRLPCSRICHPLRSSFGAHTIDERTAKGGRS